jgi:glycosyltransferase involved in cell wall biosynthesis
MGKSIAMLLNNGISNDYRVIKMIQTLSKSAKVDLFYIDGKPEDQSIFDENVELYNLEHIINFKTKLIRHSFFCYEFNFMADAVIKTGKKYDVVFANDLPTLYPAQKIAQTLKANLVYDSHEIFNETLNQFFPQKTSPLKKVIFNALLKIMRGHGTRVEKKILPKTDFFITVNQSLLDYFMVITPTINGRVVMNLPMVTTQKISDPIDFKAKYNWNDKDVIFIYQGFLNEGRGLKLLTDTFHESDSKCKLVIVGSGPLNPLLHSIVENNNSQDRIKFIPQVKLAELSSYTRGADIGINLLEDFNLSKKLASPNKLFEYIHANVPVLSSNTIENKRVIDKFGLGILIENTPATLIEGISEIINLSGQKRFSPDKFDSAKKFYDWDNQNLKILEILN